MGHDWNWLDSSHEMADALNAVNGQVYAVADVNEEMLKKFASEKHIKKTYSNPDDLIADPNVDIVYIATPHTFHYDYIKKALNANKHVFCEKAITVNARQFDEVEKLAQEKGLILTEGFTLYHMPIYQKVLNLIKDSKLGQIKMIQVNFGSLKDYDPKNRFFNKDLAGGALLDIGGYATAFARTFLDEAPESILTSVKFFETGVDEQSGIIMNNTKDQMVVMALSMRAKQPKRGVVSGTKATSKLINIRVQLKLILLILPVPMKKSTKKSLLETATRPCNMKLLICKDILIKATMMVNCRCRMILHIF